MTQAIWMGTGSRPLDLLGAECERLKQELDNQAAESINGQTGERALRAGRVLAGGVWLNQLIPYDVPTVMEVMMDPNLRWNRWRRLLLIKIALFGGLVVVVATVFRWLLERAA